VQFQPGDLVKYHWEDWRSPPKEEYIGIVIRIYKVSMLEVIWSKDRQRTLIFPECLILLANKKKKR